MSSLAGNLLVARPALRDGFFGRSVILMLEDGPERTIGLVLNRPAQAKELPFPVYIGGPCTTDGLWMIHARKEWLDPDGDVMEICPGVFLGTQEHFEKATEEGESSSDKFRVFAGYAGWGPKQLDAEMQEDAWIVVPGSAALIFDTPVLELWSRLAPPTLPQPSMN